MKEKYVHSLYLLLAALFWGMGFIGQDVAGSILGIFSINCLRYFIAAAVLVPVILIKFGNFSVSKRTLTFGMIGGVCTAFASLLQQYCISMTSPGKACFITTLFIVFIPVFGLFIGRKAKISIIPALVLAVLGLYFLCIEKGEKIYDIGRGELLCIIAAALYAIQILAVDEVAVESNPLKLSFVQFVVAFVIGLVPMCINGLPSLSDIRLALLPLLFVGIFSSSAADSLQNAGQKGVPASIASIIMSFESCFAVLFSWYLLGIAMSARELLGCVLMFGAIIVAELF